MSIAWKIPRQVVTNVCFGFHFHFRLPELQRWHSSHILAQPNWNLPNPLGCACVQKLRCTVQPITSCTTGNWPLSTSGQRKIFANALVLVHVLYKNDSTQITLSAFYVCRWASLVCFCIFASCYTMKFAWKKIKCSSTTGRNILRTIKIIADKLWHWTMKYSRYLCIFVWIIVHECRGRPWPLSNNFSKGFLLFLLILNFHIFEGFTKYIVS